MPEQQTRLLAERYELVAPLGRGTMGTVWRARDRALGREVAVKEIRQDPGLTDEQRSELRERMVREGRIAARINHPSVAAIHDVLIQDDSPWIIMELIEARSLEQVIEEEGPLPPRLVAEIGVDLLGALRAAHAQGITHRDVKPGNVLITESGRVVLTDFGIAKAEGDSRLTKTGMVIGSPGYTAPERARGEYTGPESDIWSLGATLYFAVEGRPAYERSTIAETLAALLTESADPPTQAGRLRPVLNGLLSKDYRQRLSAAKAETLMRMVADTPTSEMPVLTAEALMAQEAALPDPFTDPETPGPEGPGGQGPAGRGRPGAPTGQRPGPGQSRGAPGTQGPGGRGTQGAGPPSAPQHPYGTGGPDSPGGPGRQPGQRPAGAPGGPRGAGAPGGAAAGPGGVGSAFGPGGAPTGPNQAYGQGGAPTGPNQAFGQGGAPSGPNQAFGPSASGPNQPSGPQGQPRGGPGSPTVPQNTRPGRPQQGQQFASQAPGGGSGPHAGTPGNAGRPTGPHAGMPGEGDYDPDKTVNISRRKGPLPAAPEQGQPYRPADEGSMATTRLPTQKPGSPGHQVYPPTAPANQPQPGPQQQAGQQQVPYESQGLGTDLFSIASQEEQKPAGNRNGMLVLMAVAAAAAVVIAVLIVALLSS
ncbi:serine/threonine-protein kinase [Nonomuraea insulae]|uniref:non-specific serine/threonine protein kinase n=1 Tax=Nonomuraea insulae TaxID=1616787 RepID=A0ABW1CYW3_9ACTN